VTKVLIDGKVCSKCYAFKSASDFHKDKGTPTGLAYYCKECANSSAREHHKKRASDPSWSQKRRDKLRESARLSKLKAIEYLGNGCFDCGRVYPAYVYDIHHLDGNTKLDNPSRLLRGDWEVAKAELDKCVLLCANCHRERHHSDQGFN